MIGAGVAGSLIGLQAGLIFWFVQYLSGSVVVESVRPGSSELVPIFYPCELGARPIFSFEPESIFAL